MTKKTEGKTRSIKPDACLLILCEHKRSHSIAEISVRHSFLFFKEYNGDFSWVPSLDSQFIITNVLSLSCSSNTILWNSSKKRKSVEIIWIIDWTTRFSPFGLLYSMAQNFLQHNRWCAMCINAQLYENCYANKCVFFWERRIFMCDIVNSAWAKYVYVHLMTSFHNMKLMRFDMRCVFACCCSQMSVHFGDK